MAEAVEREPEVQTAAPVAEGAAPILTAGSGPESLGAGHSRPSLSRAVVMRLQGSAGNAAVNGLIGGAPTGHSKRHPERGPTEADSQIMAAIVARAPVDTTGPVVRDELDVPAPSVSDSATTTESTAAAGPATATEAPATRVDTGAAAGGPAAPATEAPAASMPAATAGPAAGVDAAGGAAATAGPAAGVTAAGSDAAAAGPAAGVDTGAASGAPAPAGEQAAAATAGPAAGVTAAGTDGAAGAGPAAGVDAGAATGAPAAAAAPAAGVTAAGTDGAAAAGPAAGVDTGAAAAAGEQAAAAAGPAAGVAAGTPGAAAADVAGASPGAAVVETAGKLAGALGGAPDVAAAAGPAVAAGMAGPAAAPAGGAPDVATESVGPDEGGAAPEGPSEEEIAELEARLAQGPQAASAEETGAPAEGTGAPAEDTAAETDDGAVLSRAPAEATMEPASAEMENELVDDEPVDQAAVAADAQGELEAMGAAGGPDVAPGGGGGGGGGPVEAQPEPPAPDVSNADPAQAVQAAASLKPAQMLETLGGAETAASKHVEKEQKKLQDNPPEIEAGGGPDAPAADEKFQSSEPNRPQTAKAAVKTGGEPEKPAATPAPPPKAPLPPAPAVAGDEKGNVGADGAAKIKAGIDALPTADGAVAVPSVTAPKTVLAGAADPGQMAEQQQHLDQTVAKATAQGAQEAQEPAGEDHLAPTVKAEKIKAEIAPAGPGAAGPGAGGAGADDEAVNVIADQESGPALKAQIAQASGQINSEQQQHAAKAAQDKAAAVEQAAAEDAKGKADQIAEHAAAKAGVAKARSDWTSEQKQQADEAKQEAVGHVKEAAGAIQAEKTRADADALKHVQAGVKEAEDAKRKGDEDARREKEKAKEESSGGGFFGWVASRAKALYDKVKDGITNIFNKVRQAITTAINKAKEIAHSVIDRAVKFVADKIKAVASKLIALGDKLIPGFKALRTKFRNWIVARVRQAVQALNRIVTAVKDGIRRVMQAVGNALKAGLDLLKKGISAAINAVKNAVKAAIEKAKALIATLAQFAVIIKDVAANPGAWIRNLGAAIMDGIKNHLWAALKAAISEWFNSKVEQLLGLGKSVWNLLTKGGISMAKVGKMAWEAIKAAIPPALIAILVERLVSMIVPAAGAVMAIVQGLMAAWGAIQRILAAIDRFINFLKAVRSGNAGPAFAQALAAAAVAVIEFVSQFLLRKIAGAASKVAGKIKAIAQKIGKRLMAAMKKVGKTLKKGWNKLKAKATKAKEKLFGPKKKKTKEDEAAEKQERLDKAVAAIRPALARLLAKGASGLRLKAQLLFWKTRYRLTALTMEKSGNRATFTAKVNPLEKVGDGIVPTGDDLHKIVLEVAGKVLAHPDVELAAPNAYISKEGDVENWQVGSKTHGYLGWIAEQRRRGTPPAGTRQHTQIGESGVDVKEKRVYEGGSAHDLRIWGAGAYTPGSNALKGLDAEIIRIGRESGMDEVDTATMIRQFATTQEFPPSIPEDMKKMLATRTHLLFGRESARHAPEVAFSAMTIDRIEQGDLSWKDAFNKPGALAKDSDIDRQLTSGGENPMSFRGSSRAADDTALGGVPADVTAPKEREKREKGVKELKDREIAMAENWLKMKMAAEGQIYFDDVAHARQWIYDQLLKFFAAKSHTLS